MPPDAASWYKKLAKLLKRALSKEIADASFMYGNCLHGLGHINLSA